MKSNMLRTGTGLVATAIVLALAVHVTAVRAEEPDPSPGLDGVVVRLCTESADIGSVYCSNQGEIIASQAAQTREFDLNRSQGTKVTLPGSFRFTASQLNQAGGLPRAVVYGPIQGFYEGRNSAWFWGVMFRDDHVEQYYFDNPTELFDYGLGTPGYGLELSPTAEYALDFAYSTFADFGHKAYYVTIYLDQSVGPLANPGIGSPASLGGQVWGRQQPPAN